MFSTHAPLRVPTGTGGEGKSGSKPKRRRPAKEELVDTRTAGLAPCFGRKVPGRTRWLCSERHTGASLASRSEQVTVFGTALACGDCWYSVTTAGGTSAAFTAAMHTALQSAGTLGSVPSESLQPLNDVIIGIGSYLHDKATAYRAARRSRSKKSQAIPSSDTPATFGGPSLTVPSNAHWRGTEEEGSRDCLVPSKLRPLFLQVLDSYSPSSFSQVQGGDDGRDESDDVDDTAEGPDTANPCCDFDIGQSQSQGTNSPEFFTPHPATASSVAASDREFDTRSGNMAKPREEDRSPVTSFQPTDFALRGLDDSSAVGGFSFGRPRETEIIGVRTPPHLPRVDQDDPTGRSAATSLYPEDQLPEAPLSPEGLRPANTSADSYFPVFLP